MEIIKKRRKKILFLRIRKFLSILFDGLGAFLLMLYAIIIGPLGILRGPIVIERTIRYVSVLAPLGLLVRSVRAGVDWRLGHFALATSQVESIIALVEEHRLSKRNSRASNRVLIDFYTLLTRAYLHMGDIDEAMAVVMRAKKSLGKDYLADLVGVDAKTAQLVRAGISAGKLLGGDGLATLFVKSTTDPSSQVSHPKNRGAFLDDEKSPNTAKSGIDYGNLDRKHFKRKGASSNLIPFPGARRTYQDASTPVKRDRSKVPDISRSIQDSASSPDKIKEPSKSSSDEGKDDNI